MATDASDKLHPTDSNGSTDGNKTNADDAARTPIRKNMKKSEDNAAKTPVQKPIKKSASLAALEGSSLGWDMKTPIETIEFYPRAIHADNNNNDDDALYFPPPRPSAYQDTPSAYQETPVLSNVRKRSEDKAKPSALGKSVFAEKKSVSFGYDNGNAIPKNGNDDAYGHYFSTSSVEGESPARLQHRWDKNAAGGKANANNSFLSDGWKEKIQEDHQQQEVGDLTDLSIPDLSTSKQQISYAAASKPHHRRHSSFMSDISFDSDMDHNDFDLPPPPRKLSRDDSHKILHLHSDRRYSLTVDMETGKSPDRSSMEFNRGQHAIRRVMSTEMLDAQSPRIRRRRALSQNIDQLRRGLLNNVQQFTSQRLLLPAVMSASDIQKFQGLNQDKGRLTGGRSEQVVGPKESEQEQQSLSLPEGSRSDSLKTTDRIRRNRYNVEQKSVRVLNDKQSRNRHRGKYTEEVQYRLSAITPIELRRRRYKENLHRNGSNGEDTNNEKNNTKNGGRKSVSKCRQCLASVGNFLVETAIIILTQGKQSYSVGVVNKFLYWTFRKHFLVVLLSALCSFYICTGIFGLLIFLLGQGKPQCIHVNGVNFGDTRTQIVDAFALSWTTFSTVGYGLVYPGTSATIPEDTKIEECIGIFVITTMEAFVGILFSGFWGAICFAKITRVSSFAQVSFSDAIIIKYGMGVTGVKDGDEEEYEEGSSDEDDGANTTSSFKYTQSKLPCPIFEFRIANRLHRQKGGEIIDACINIVASMEESKATRTVRNGEGMAPRIRRKGRRPKQSNDYRKFGRWRRDPYADERTEEEIMREENVKKAQEAVKIMISSYNVDESKKGRRISSITSASRLPVTNDNQDEENQNNQISSTEQIWSSRRNNKPISNQIFAKLNVESMEHPFLKRVWTVRHVLDVTSPLVKPEVKELIRINKGHWPEEVNSANAVRASIHFDQVLVSFSGTSNVDANSVYSQKAYTLNDINVGYAFCNMLFREKNGSIGVDHSLLNDVKEQSGGGGEELFAHDPESSNRNLSNILIL